MKQEIRAMATEYNDYDRALISMTKALGKYSRNSPTWSISHNILVSSMAHRPKGHSCLSSRLLFSRTIC